jgi:hypothetical protein
VCCWQKDEKLGTHLILLLLALYFIVKEVDGVSVQLEGQGFEEGNVIGHHFFIGEVKFVHDDRVNVVVTQ